MSEIFREIDEELRRENFLKLWQRYGRYVILVAVVGVAAAALFAGWREYRERQRQALGLQYSAALDLAHQGKDKDAVTALAAVAQEAGGGRGLIAQFQEAALDAKSGDTAGAVAIYDHIAADGAVDPVYRDLATLRSATYAVDKDPKAAIARVQPLTDANSAWHASALEITALAQIKEGDIAAARTSYQKISDDLNAPPGMRARAAEMIATLGR